MSKRYLSPFWLSETSQEVKIASHSKAFKSAVVEKSSIDRPKHPKHVFWTQVSGACRHICAPIPDQVLTVATNLGFPVLGVHDSFIIAREHQDTLLAIVNTASREILGVELPLDVTVSTQEPVRTKGYRARLEAHLERGA